MGFRTKKDKAIDNIVNYGMDDERKHLEEYIGESFGSDAAEEISSFDDAQLYNYCIDNKIVHIWSSYYIVLNF